MTRLGAIVEVHVADRGRDRRRGLGLVYARRYVQLDPSIAGKPPNAYDDVLLNFRHLAQNDVRQREEEE